MNKTFKKITVLLGDPRLADAVKRNGKFNPEDLETIKKLHAGLQQLQQYEFHYLDNDKKLISDLLSETQDLVLNLCDEGFNNNPLQECHVPALLEMLNISYTGAAPACLAICYNKSLVRALAKEMEIPVPEEYYLEDKKPIPAISFFPVFVKPNLGDSSIGITQHSIVHNEQELTQYIKYLGKLLPGVSILIQEYLPGSEYTVGIIGNPGNFNILPILTVDYSELPATLPPILGYESKWDPQSPYWSKIHYKEAKLTEIQHEALINYSTKLFIRLNCRDYARFDFRMDQQGIIKLLEVNPNPGWCWDGKMNIMSQLSGHSYSDLLQMILQAAIRRISL